jgi:hypothetical protein
MERLPTTWVRTIALVAFRRTTGGVVPSDRLVTLCDVVLTDGVGAGLIVAGPPADHGESMRVRPAARVSRAAGNLRRHCARPDSSTITVADDAIATGKNICGIVEFDDDPRPHIIASPHAMCPSKPRSADIVR